MLHPPPPRRAPRGKLFLNSIYGVHSRQLSLHAGKRINEEFQQDVFQRADPDEDFYGTYRIRIER